RGSRPVRSLPTRRSSDLYSHHLQCLAVREQGAPLPAFATEAAASDEQEPRELADFVDFDGTASMFRWPALPPGSYRVEVLVPGIDRKSTRLNSSHVKISY